MRTLREQIASWENVRRSTNDELMVEVCDNALKQLKRRQFWFECFDWFCKIVGLLTIIGGMAMFYYGLFTDKPISLILGSALIYFGFKIAKGV